MSRLLERSDSLLVVVDAQPGFHRIPDERVPDILARIAWLVGVAAALDVPVVVTEEDVERNGPTNADIAANLPSGTPVLAKPVFGLADDREIRAAIVWTEIPHLMEVPGEVLDGALAHLGVTRLDAAGRPS